MIIKTCYQSPLGRTDWKEVDIPTTLGSTININTIIVFAEELNTDRIFWHRSPLITTNKNMLLIDYINGLTPDHYTEGRVTLVEHSVRYELCETNYTTKRVKFGYHPDSSVTISEKDSILVRYKDEEGYVTGKQKLFTLGGLAHQVNLSRFGATLRNADRALKAGFDRIGAWDFSEIGEIEQHSFDPARVTNITEMHFDYILPEPMKDSSWLFFCLGRLQLNATQIMNETTIRFKLSHRQRRLLYVWLWKEFQIDLGFESIPNTNDKSKWLSEITSDQGLIKMLNDTLSFFIEVKSPVLHTEITPSQNYTNHIITQIENKKYPLQTQTQNHPEYRTIPHDGLSLYRIYVSGRTVPQHDTWFDDGMPNYVSVTVDSYKGVLPFVASKLKLYYNDLAFT